MGWRIFEDEASTCLPLPLILSLSLSSLCLTYSQNVRTVDIGNPQLSMHSIREMCGSYDVDYKIRLFVEFFRSFEEVDAELHVD